MKKVLDAMLDERENEKKMHTADLTRCKAEYYDIPNQIMRWNWMRLSSSYMEVTNLVWSK